MEKNGTIELEGMEFTAFHGCLEHERREGNLFTVDFKGEVDISKAAETDALEDTLDYGKIYDIVAEQMRTPSNLLENVVYRIASAISREFPYIGQFSVRVSKRNPPVSGTAAWSRVTLSCHPEPHSSCHPEPHCHPEQSEGSETPTPPCHHRQSEGSEGSEI